MAGRRGRHVERLHHKCAQLHEQQESNDVSEMGMNGRVMRVNGCMNDGNGRGTRSEGPRRKGVHSLS